MNLTNRFTPVPAAAALLLHAALLAGFGQISTRGERLLAQAEATQFTAAAAARRSAPLDAAARASHAPLLQDLHRWLHGAGKRADRPGPV
ncbi:MAG: hypothetical protein P4L83_22875 [Nevskia sp.]|nr:hypothetical protein [Nevskia sp.]